MIFSTGSLERTLAFVFPPFFKSAKLVYWEPKLLLPDYSQLVER